MQGLERGTTEIVCQSDKDGIITSGGGFSTYYPQPAYQRNTTSEYFAQFTSTTGPYPGFNSSKRGYPDITAAGSNFLYVSGGFVKIGRAHV